MATIKALLNRFQKLDTDAVIVKSMRDSADALADLNVEQMNKGLRSDGSKIGPDYASDEYAEMKHQMNPVPGLGVPDLKLTGAFQQGLYVKVNADGTMTEKSTDAKNDKLEKRYNKKTGGIFGLSPTFKRVFLSESLRPNFKKNMEAATGLKMK